MKKIHTISRYIFILLLTCLVSELVQAQDSTSTSHKIFHFPEKTFASIETKANGFSRRADNTTRKYLARMCRQEIKMKRAIWKKDSAAAKYTFGDVTGHYDSLRTLLENKSSANQYNAHLDSLQTALRFLDHEGGSLSPEQMKRVSSSLEQTQARLNQTHQVAQLLEERKEMIRATASRLGNSKALIQYRKDLYYYKAQIHEYTDMWAHPDKLESKLLTTLKNTGAFKQFFSKYSQLSGLFKLPGADDASGQAIAGLQTRDMVMKNLQQQLGTGASVNSYISQSMTSAQGALDKVKNKTQSMGQAESEADIPNFKPNSQKTKAFLKRFELGTNLQSVKSNYLLPVTTDFGMSLGYKLGNKTTAGIGGSYRMGWGNDWRHISITHQGVGLRTFLEMKLKGSFWASGGQEWNYRSEFHKLDQLKNYNAWQQSALLGISKKYKISQKLSGNLQVMYDFLSSRQVPRTTPVIFRTGYKF